MAFREEEEALRARVSSLEDELERAHQETDALRRAFEGTPSPAPMPEPERAPVVGGATVAAPWQRPRWLIPVLLGLVVVVWLLAPPPGPTGTSSIWHASSVHVGEAIYAEWSGQWYPARVLAVHGRSVRVHYDGLPASDDEDVSAWRIRVRTH